MHTETSEPGEICKVHGRMTQGNSQHPIYSVEPKPKTRNPGTDQEKQCSIVSLGRRSADPTSKLLQLADDPATGQAPLLTDPLFIDDLTQKTAAGKVLIEATRLIAGKATKSVQLERVDSLLDRLEQVQDARVSIDESWGIGILGRRSTDPSLAGVQTIQGDTESRGVGGA